MKSLLRPTARLLAAGGAAVALLIGFTATAQARELTPQCSGGCTQWAPAASMAEAAGTDGNWEPN
ncbi:hypothetical protein [Streptomyces candidus]|uniref:Uncharacterized protein n=1 Tax=Streptomyces candidus TaxID=67283 RepID=A0A7X0HK30_9ACTN|nr:hypothetical protein [Streptomyces candidus]MBB6439116.1 hypothetical protein [Streptomyces candidus]GHH55711.1 hypothetical protein GCM10018773_60590 [Streptomyces candidus]